jgi:hypothetical protein
MTLNVNEAPYRPSRFKFFYVAKSMVCLFIIKTPTISYSTPDQRIKYVIHRQDLTGGHLTHGSIIPMLVARRP